MTYTQYLSEWAKWNRQGNNPFVKTHFQYLQTISLRFAGWIVI